MPLGHPHRRQYSPANAGRMQEEKILQDVGFAIVFFFIKFAGFYKLEPRYFELTNDWFRIYKRSVDKYELKRMSLLLLSSLN